jgi:hypothetical protein
MPRVLGRAPARSKPSGLGARGGLALHGMGPSALAALAAKGKTLAR